VQTLISDDAYEFIDNTNKKAIGMSNYNTFFSGIMDEVRLWNVARDSMQIRENMCLRLTGEESGLIGYWQCNEGSGDTTYGLIGGHIGTLFNMADSSWINSTIPFGDGFSSTQTEVTGTVDFTGTSLSMSFNSIGSATLTVTRIDTTANINPADPDNVFDEQYWVVNRYGSGGFEAELTFTINEDLLPGEETSPENIKLYTRGSNADTNWVYLASADSIDAANNKAVFDSITQFSQFIIARYLDTITLPVDLILQNIIVDTGETEIYKASRSITAAGGSTYFIVKGTDSTAGNATFNAGSEILLNDGFDAEFGSLFEAEIDTNLSGPQAKAKAEAEEGRRQMAIVPGGSEGVFILRLKIGEGEKARVEVVDVAGRKIYSNDRAGAETIIDLSSQPEGTYTVSVWFGDRLFVEEITLE